MRAQNRPTRLEVLEYAEEGLRTLIGTGTGYEYPCVLDEYEQHLEWVKKELTKVRAKEAAS